MIKKAFIYDKHQCFQDWLSRLAFYKEELAILKEQLIEIANKKIGTKQMDDVDLFFRKFIDYRAQIELLINEIKINDHQLSLASLAGSISNEIQIEVDKNEEASMRTFESNFANLRQEYNRFVAQFL
ncbi:MAG: hypothetical protein RL264_1360 [Bacteroidota bacterium]|jgi:hypothetical protein